MVACGWSITVSTNGEDTPRSHPRMQNALGPGHPDGVVDTPGPGRGRGQLVRFLGGEQVDDLLRVGARAELRRVLAEQDGMPARPGNGGHRLAEHARGRAEEYRRRGIALPADDLSEPVAGYLVEDEDRRIAADRGTQAMDRPELTRADALERHAMRGRPRREADAERRPHGRYHQCGHAAPGSGGGHVAPRSRAFLEPGTGPDRAEDDAWQHERHQAPARPRLVRRHRGTPQHG